MTRFILTLLVLLTLSRTEAQQEVDSLKNELNKASKNVRVKILSELSWYYKNFHLDSAERYARQAILEARKVKNDREKLLAAGYNSLANVFEAASRMDSAEHFHKLSLNLKTQIGDSIGMADSYNNLGILYDLTDKNELSIKEYLKALTIYERNSDDPLQIAMVLTNLGIVLKKLDENQEALKYYNRALEIYKSQKSDFGIIVTSGNIGALLLKLGQYQQSVPFSDTAIQGYRKLGYLRYVPYSQLNKAIALDSLGFWEEAISNYKESIRQHKEHENLKELATAENSLANLLIKTGDLDFAKQLATEAVLHATELNAPQMKVKSLLTLARAELKLGNHAKASQYFMEYIIGNDSLYQAEKTKKIVELQTKYETEKKEQQIALQQAQIAEQELINERNQILVSTLVGAVTLLLIVGLLTRSRLKWKNRQLLEEQKRLAREAEMNAVISSQEKERNRFARDLHDGFGQLISTLNLQLRNLDSKSSRSERDELYESSSHILEEMYQELKNVCFDLMPQTLIKHGLPEAIQEFASRINSTGKMNIELHVHGLENRLTELQEISLYRVMQEWVNNILKYSDAEKITIQITREERELTLLIEDNGMAFDQSLLKESKGNGWRNMTSRVALIKGELEIDNQPGIRGNTLIVNAQVEVFESVIA